ncbi:energy coupling factor transporter S component ThiW [Oceanobacillus piezotolerans]|uniref:Energy coupling factor transporter S component ThiW n=1 Tax=Oceanobacillus piezotolerans TaxID=2448030 RepID=A0A498D2S8_9BACI|nr:energy coupling factor transporter S component ThiW [Oceanobacillus piezotolerans]RLL42022.1 energy coupling factor transporter S component ThiW [Oceanobacillus piezotolerans]
MNKTRLLTTMAVFVAIGTITAQLIWFPAGIARAYPMQHAINVIAGVLLGPGPAVIIAFMIGVLRNLLGLGTLLAFPGGMVGAFLAGYFYKKSGKKGFAAFGEGLGSGIIGAFAAVPFAYVFMGSAVGAFAFLPPFLVSSLTGSIIGWLIISRVKANTFLSIHPK